MEGNVDKVINALKPLAEKIGEGGKFLYGVFYRQTVVEGILQMVLTFIGMIVMTILAYKLGKLFLSKQAERAKRIETIKKRQGYSWEENNWTGALIALACSVVFAFSLLVPFFVQGALKVGNPHYYTIQRIIDSVQEKELK